MSRFDPLDNLRDERAREAEAGSRLPLSQGRNGGSSEIGVPSEAAAVAQLAQWIDEATHGQPSLPELIERLREKGVRAIPSLQRSGRLNGMSYEMAGLRVKGSRVGRAYTAQGLQERCGVRYDPDRDDARLRGYAEPFRAAPETSSDPDRSEASGTRDPASRDSRERLGRASGLRLSERELLAEIGRFRVVALADLTRGDNDRNRPQGEQDLRSLEKQRLVTIRRVPVSVARTLPPPAARFRKARAGAAAAPQICVVTLTREGRAWAREDRWHGAQQALYQGLVKPGEVAHDTTVYRMFQQERAHIEASGGRIRRVVLDYELKRRVYSPLEKSRQRNATPAEQAQRQAEVAQANGLRVVQGRIPLPDLRVEYEDERGELTQVDLELATSHYHGSQRQAKAAAGFKIYQARTGPGGTPGEYDHVTELISL